MDTRINIFFSLIKESEKQNRDKKIAMTNNTKFYVDAL